MEGLHLDHLRHRGGTSLSIRLQRWRSKLWHICQCALAAAAAWLIATEAFGHDSPFFAPIAAVVSLGTSYGQRLRRVVEVAVGVAVGVLVADLLVVQIGSGGWQLAVIVALAMSAGVLISGSPLFVTQAAVQSIVVCTLLPDAGEAVTRWSDAVIGGAVALVAATVVPAAPLRRPREQAAVVVRKISELLRCSADVMISGEVGQALDLLTDARATDAYIRELQDAAQEGMAVVRSSPFRVRHKRGVRRMGDLVEPLDRALRSTRVLIRSCATSAYKNDPVPASYAALARELADVTDLVAEELSADRMATAARPALLKVGAHTGTVERSDVLAAEVMLAQIRAVIADFLLLTGLDALESTDALPPPPR